MEKVKDIKIKVIKKQPDIENKSFNFNLREEVSERETEKKEEPARVNAVKSFLQKNGQETKKWEDSFVELKSENGKAKDEKNNYGKISRGKTSLIFDKIVTALLCFLVFSLPLFVLPFSMEIYEFNKTLLLFIISSLAFFVWITKMILVDKCLVFVRTPLDVPIIIFISLVLISAAFSVDKVSSVLGFYGRFSDSLLVYLSLAVFYFVAINRIAKKTKNSEVLNEKESDSSPTENMIKAFLASSFIIVIAALFYFFGFKFISWPEAQFRSFNFTSGSINVFAIYLTTIILISLHYYQQRRKKENSLARKMVVALIVMSVVLLAIIDFVQAWIVLAVSLIVALFLSLAARSFCKNNFSLKGIFILSSFIILISLAFIVSSLSFISKEKHIGVEGTFSTSLISSSIKDRIVPVGDNQMVNNNVFNREVVLDKKTALSVAIEGIKHDPFAGVVGSGPGTYLYNFSKYKPVEFNKGLFWNVRFDKAGSEILEKISTIGILGISSYLFVAVLTIIIFLRTDFRRRSSEDGLSKSESGNAYLFAAWTSLLLFQFLYLESMTIKFVFWLLTAIIVMEHQIIWKNSFVVALSSGFVSGNAFILNLKKEKSAFYSSLLVLLILFLVLFSAYYYQIKFYRAETRYKQVVLKQDEALSKSNLSSLDTWDILEKNTNELKKAIDENPYRGTYKIYLSDIYSNRMKLVFQEEIRKDEKTRDNQKIAREAKNVVNYAKEAADANINNIIFQHKIADVYAIAERDVGIVGVGEWAIKKYKRAIDLEPTNPALYVSLGRIYVLNYSANQTEEANNRAIEEYKKALELKEDYPEAILQLGIAYENKGDNEKAIKILNSTGIVQRVENVAAAGQIVLSQSVDIDIAFQLGRIYYNAGETSKAKRIFEDIRTINPNHSNARYSLGLIYEKENNLEGALAEFEAVLSVNSENEDVKEKIRKLEGKNSINKKEERSVIDEEITNTEMEENIKEELKTENENENKQAEG